MNDSGSREDIIAGKNQQLLATWKSDGIVFAKGLNIDKKKFNKMLAEFFSEQ